MFIWATSASSIASAICLIQQRVFRGQNFASGGMHYIFANNPAQNTFGQGCNDFTVIHRGLRLDGVFGAAIVHADDAILCHVNKTTRQIARVRSLQRRIRKTFTGPVGRVEVF